MYNNMYKCMEYVIYIYDKVAAPVKSQKYGCLSKPHTMAIPVGMPVWVRGIPQGPTDRWPV